MGIGDEMGLGHEDERRSWQVGRRRGSGGTMSSKLKSPSPPAPPMPGMPPGMPPMPPGIPGMPPPPMPPPASSAGASSSARPPTRSPTMPPSLCHSSAATLYLARNKHLQDIATLMGAEQWSASHLEAQEEESSPCNNRVPATRGATDQHEALHRRGSTRFSLPRSVHWVAEMLEG